MNQTVREGAPGVVYAFLRGYDRKRREKGQDPVWVTAFERFAEQRFGADWQEKWKSEH